jgi:hypothetical protein
MSSKEAYKQQSSHHERPQITRKYTSKSASSSKIMLPKVSKSDQSAEKAEAASKKTNEPPKTPRRQMILEPTSPGGAPQRIRRPRSNGFSEFDEKEGSYLKLPFIGRKLFQDVE